MSGCSILRGPVAISHRFIDHDAKAISSPAILRTTGPTARDGNDCLGIIRRRVQAADLGRRACDRGRRAAILR
jgi:hypothetical protein